MKTIVYKIYILNKNVVILGNNSDIYFVLTLAGTSILILLVIKR